MTSNTVTKPNYVTEDYFEEEVNCTQPSPPASSKPSLMKGMLKIKNIGPIL
jgi:hypothetical protein